MKFQQSAIVRKGKAFATKPIRFAHRLAAKPGYPDQCKAVLCNSFPKSGTHLMLQALQALPETTFYGSFLASVPSIRFKLRSPASHLRKINAIAPREVVPAHLYHSNAVADQLQQQNIAHYFIYRDLRDVVVSEAFYLSSMAWWHRLSREFRRTPDMESRLILSIEGLPDQFASEYPDIASRFRFYARWVDDENCLAIKFEDLVDHRREETLATIARFYEQVTGVTVNIDRYIQDANLAIDPSRSHTFRSGKKRGWEEHFTPRIREAFDRVAGNLLAALQYD